MKATVERTMKAALAILSICILAACGNLTAGGFGETSILVTSEGEGEDQPAPSAQASPSSPSSQSSQLEGADPLLPDELAGTLQVTLRVYFLDTSNFWTEVTNGPVSMTLPLSDGGLEEAVKRRINTGLYSQMRMVFSTIEADVTGGLFIGGIPLLGTVHVPTGSDVIIERPLDLFIDDRDPVSVVIELNAGEWLQTASLVDAVVTPEDFASSVSVRPGN